MIAQLIAMFYKIVALQYRFKDWYTVERAVFLLIVFLVLFSLFWAFFIPFPFISSHVPKNGGG